MRYIKLMIHYYKLNLLSFWSYQIDFIAWIITSIVELFVSVINVNLIFNNVDNISGWTFYEIIFLTSLLYLARFVWHTFLINSNDIGYFIRNGSLDYYLTKPLPPLFQLMLKDRYNLEFDWDDLIGGTILLIISSIKLNLCWDIKKILLLLIIIISGGFIYAGIVLIASITAFWTLKSNSMVRIFKTGSSLATYPVSLYSKPIQYILIYLLPFAFINYFPTVYFVRGQCFIQAILSPCIGIIIWIVVVLFWNYALSKYQSVGN